jgi:hypothetical protein
LNAEVDRSLPPETLPDPLRPVSGPDGKTSLEWQRSVLNSDGVLDLTPYLHGGDPASVYVLTRVYAPEDRSTVALVANDGWLRFWCNGTLVRAQPLQYQPLYPVPIRLRAGWNTLLCKVTNWEGPASLTLKLSEGFDEITRGVDAIISAKGWSEENAALVEGLYSLVPAERRWLQNAAECLAARLAQRDEI